MKNIFLLFGIAILIVLGITAYRNSKKEKPMVLIMMGPPGSGKGTHATNLSKTLNLPHISTGDLFRENIRNQTEIGKIAKALIDKGNLVPDNIVVDMLFQYIKSNGYDKTGYILDGFPRTLNQAKALDQRLENNYNKIALNLNIDEAKLVDRITGRLMCKSCGNPYHKTYLPPKVENVCDKCSGELYQRKDDTKEVLKQRLDVYYKETQPLLEYYKKQKKLYEIDSNSEKEVVFENLVEKITQSKV